MSVTFPLLLMSENRYAVLRFHCNTWKKYNLEVDSMHVGVGVSEFKLGIVF